MERIGKYEILEEIGQGGFGTVYRGRDTVLKRLVAVKTCLSDEGEIRARFQREAEVVASLQHPNITIVHDFGTHDGVPYLVQEYLSGEDLTDVIARKEELSLDTKVEYLVQSARGLGHAHQHGIVHRDAKPGNIRRLDDGSIKVMDFGIAKLTNLQTKLTRTGTMLGTAAYLAPEQLGDGDIGPQCDIFSFGVLAYELLAYKRPFEGTTISALLYQVMSQDAPPLKEVCDCPESLSLLLERCMQKAAEARPESFDEVIACLTQPEHVQTASVAQGEMATILGPTPDAAQTVIAKAGASPSGSLPTVHVPAATTASATSSTAAQDVSRAFVPASKGLLWGAIAASVATLLALFFFQRNLQSTLSPESVESAPQVADTALPSATESDDPTATETLDEDARDVTPEPSPDEPARPTVDAEPPADKGSRAAEKAPTRQSSQRTHSPESSTAKEPARPPARSSTPQAEPARVAARTADSPSPAARAERAAEKTIQEQPASSRSTAPARQQPQSAAPESSARAAAPTRIAAARPTVDRVQPPPQAAPVDESPAIEATLDRYRRAFDGRDLGALKSVWPSLTGDQLDKMDRSFRAVQSQSMKLSDCQIVVQGASATADCSVYREVKPKAGRRQSATTQTVFRLIKSKGTWFVESI